MADNAVTCELFSLVTGKNTGNSMALVWRNMANTLASKLFAQICGKTSREFSDVYQGIDSMVFHVLVGCYLFHPPQQQSWLGRTFAHPELV